MSIHDDNSESMTWRRFGAYNIQYHSILEGAHRTQTTSMLWKYTTNPPEGAIMSSVDGVHQRKQLVSASMGLCGEHLRTLRVRIGGDGRRSKVMVRMESVEIRLRWENVVTERHIVNELVERIQLNTLPFLFSFFFSTTPKSRSRQAARAFPDHPS